MLYCIGRLVNLLYFDEIIKGGDELKKSAKSKALKEKTQKPKGGLCMKKLLAVVLALSMVLVFFAVRPAPASAAGFPDVPANYWAKKQIDYLVTKGVIKGFPDGTFKPEAKVTREQFAKMIVAAKGLSLYKPSSPTFTDVSKSRWSYGYVEAAAKAGYIKGYPGGKFGPADPITREQLAVLEIRVLGREKEALNIKEPICFANDEKHIDPWAIGAMTLAVRPRVQILLWDSVRNIRPKDPATRAECTHSIYRILVPPLQASKRHDMTILDEEGPANFFPITSNSAYTARDVTYISSGLVGQTPDGITYPDMVTAVPSVTNGLLEVNEKAKTIKVTFILRKGLKWSDGQPITAADAVFGYNVLMNDKVQSTSRWPYNEITSIKAINDYTLVTSWNRMETYAVFGVPVLPKHILGPIYDKDPSLINSCDFVTKNPIYSGPYVLDTYVPDQYIIYKPNKYYYGGAPVLDKITVRIIKDTNTQFATFLAGGIDAGSEILTLDLAERVEKMPDINVYYNKGTVDGIMDINLDSDFFKDKRVRQAMYYAMDRYELVRRARVGQDPAMSFVPAGSWAFEDVLGKYKYNTDKANELLDEAGWKWNSNHTVRIMPNGKEAILQIPYAQGAAFREREVTIIQPMLAKVGIKVEHDPIDFDQFLVSAAHGNYTIFLHGIMFDSYDPISSLVPLLSSEIPSADNGWAGQNWNRLRDPEMDKLVNQAMDQAFDSQKERIPLLHKIQERWADDVPFILLEQRVYPDIVRKGFQNWDHYFSSTVYYNWMCGYWFWDDNLK